MCVLCIPLHKLAVVFSLRLKFLKLDSLFVEPSLMENKPLDPTVRGCFECLGLNGPPVYKVLFPLSDVS